MLLPSGGKGSTSINARIPGRASELLGVGLGVVTVDADVGTGGDAPPTGRGGSSPASSSLFSFVSRKEDEEAGAESSMITMSDA